jgi:hypothetical protein
MNTSTALTYANILIQKRKQIQPGGFKASYIPDALFPFQQFAVDRALHYGRYALFEQMGLGKTRQQIVFAYNCVLHTNKPALILCPLAVSGQTIKEGEVIGVEVKRIIHSNSGVNTTTLSPTIYICNYEQLENIEHLIPQFCCVVLDESSILKNHEGKYRNALISLFRNTPYKLPCTATPSPNDFMELGNHSELLNAMTREEMLAMYFVHDGGETNKWRLKGHAQDVFWQWVTGWALIVSKPSDIGFDNTGYDLPPLHYHVHEISTEKKGNLLFNDTAVSATDFNGELRRTMKERLERTAQIVAANNDAHLVWIRHNEEGKLLRDLIPDAIEVAGSDTTEYKEEMLLAFAAGEINRLITKTKICGYGMNFQKCNQTTFAAPDFSFEQTYQGIGRFHRFGNLKDVHANFIVTDTMSNILREFKRKKQQHEDMQQRTLKYVHAYQSRATTSTKTHQQQQIKIPTWLKK